MSGNEKELVMRRVEPGEPVPGVPDRATRVVSWLGWHTPELLGITVPVLATGVSPWAWLVSGVVGAGWTVRAVKTAREQAAVRAGRDLPAITTNDTGDRGDTGDSAEDGAGGGDVTRDVSVVDGKRAEGGAR